MLAESLEAARESIARGEQQAYRDALQHLKAALKADKTSHEALL